MERTPPEPRGSGLHRRWRGGVGRLLLVCTGDVDGDGLCEIIATAGRELKIYDWSGSTYALRHSAELPREALSLGVGDVEPGGPAAVVIGTRDRVLLYTCTALGTKLLAQSLMYPNAYFRSVGLADVNGDGRSEVVAAASGAQTMYLYQTLAVAGEGRLEEIGRIYIGGLVAAHGGDSVVASATREGFVDVFVPCSLLPNQNQTVYSVRRGDSLWRIARRFNTSPGAIARANRLAEPFVLTPGQVLIVPGQRAMPPPPPR